MSSFPRAWTLFALLPCALSAQAWLSPGGQGTVTTLYQYGFDRYHALSHSEAVDVGQREALADHDVDHIAAHHVEQFPRRARQFRLGGNVVEQGRAGQEQ